MARKPLFHLQNRPVMAVTWPFADTETLGKVKRILEKAGYHVYEREDRGVCELIIGHLNVGDEAHLN